MDKPIFLKFKTPSGKYGEGYFSVLHAERLLGMENNGGWFIPEGSKYQFEKGNGITITARGGSKESEKSADSKKSNSSRG